MNKFVMNRIRELKDQIKAAKAKIRESDTLFRRESDKQQTLREAIHNTECELIEYSDCLSEGTWTFHRYDKRSETLIFEAHFNMFPKLVKIAGGDGIHESFYLKRPGMDEVRIGFDDHQIILEISLKDYGRMSQDCDGLPVGLEELHKRKGELLLELADIEAIEQYFKEVKAHKVAEEKRRKATKKPVRRAKKAKKKKGKKR